MRLLVTGGAGYVGSVVAAELVRAGHTVVVFDNLKRGHRAAIPQATQLLVGDLSDRASLDEALKTHPVDAALHFAAFIEAGESMQAPERYFRNNSANSLTLLEALLAHGVKRLVFSSTAAVYGEPAQCPIKEDAQLRPTNPYGESKLVVERMLAWFHRVHGLRYASLRYFNAAGATGDLGEDHRPESHLIPLVMQVALGQRESISVYGTDYPTPDGTCVRDYIHISDLAAAHLLALEALGSPRGEKPLIYNLGNGRGFSVREVIAAARRVTGHAIPSVDAPRRSGDPAVLVASSDKIRCELSWQPQQPNLEQIIGSAWEWKRRHPNGYPD